MAESALQIPGLSQARKRNCWKGFADSGLDLMACTHPEGPDNRPGLHQHGLDADVLAALG